MKGQTYDEIINELLDPRNQHSIHNIAETQTSTKPESCEKL
jgi:hypothetical protein